MKDTLADRTVAAAKVGYRQCHTVEELKTKYELRYNLRGKGRYHAVNSTPAKPGNKIVWWIWDTLKLKPMYKAGDYLRTFKSYESAIFAIYKLVKGRFI